MRRITFAGLVVLALSAVLDRSGAFRYDGDDWRNFDHQSFVVTHVADGDTVTVRPPAGGPETGMPNRAANLPASVVAPATEIC